MEKKRIHFAHAKQLMRSVRFRLTLWYVVILAAILLIFGSTVYITQEQAQYAQLDAGLSAEMARFIIAYDAQRGLIPSSATIARNEIALLITPSGAVAQVLLPRSGTLPADEVSFLASQALSHVSQVGRQTSFFYTYQVSPTTAKGVARKAFYRFTDHPIRVQNHVVALLIVGQENTIEPSLHMLILTLVGTGLILLGLSTGGGFWLANRAIRPVQMITQTARQISETDLHQRLNLKRVDELGELGATFDSMLARLESAFERQRQFTADASHELRTPLTIMHLEATRMIEQPSTYEECLQALALIQTVSASMSHLVNNLLLLARSDNGQVPLTRKILDLSDIAFDVADYLIPLAHQQHISIVLGQTPELPINGDQFYLTQMVTNIVENAIKYTAHVGTHVQIETKYRKDYKQGWAGICVTDNGPGIAAEYLPRVFDRFYRIDQARTTQPDPMLALPDVRCAEKQPTGSGLGLSIAQWVARAHGGEIHIQSQKGQGTTIEIWLPCLLSQ